ncbi:nucleoside triphosphate pyrophosphohydrolase [Paenibacillus terrae]|uniref:nucleoside triphosphate pyrophosphohydrolase n=1 Tax=Paenibacillus terrae TaxID=159743 RepID=UPI0021CC8B69|nr:nucleoside triphosphate pyrophosphohydrolase [Paenibacillus terrae]
MPTYNKLVRDRIPHIITSQGKECRTRILNPKEYKQELRTKLREEAEEYFEAAKDKDALEELADMLEVIRALQRTNRQIIPSPKQAIAEGSLDKLKLLRLNYLYSFENSRRYLKKAEQEFIQSNL